MELIYNTHLMPTKTSLLATFLLLLIEFKSKVAAVNLPTVVGTFISFSTTEIELHTIVQVKAKNKVVVIPNSKVDTASIYMNITNLCEIGSFYDCEEIKPPNNYLLSSKLIRLEHKGEGVYEGEYTIENDEPGEFSLMLYTPATSVGHFYCTGTEFTGTCTELNYVPYIYQSAAQHRFDDEGTGAYSVKYRGKWVFPESRTYEVKVVNTYDSTVMQTIRLYVDGLLRIEFPITSATLEKEALFYMEEGEYEFVFEYIGRCKDVRTKLFWKHPVGSDYVEVDEMYFRSFSNNHNLAKITTVPPCSPGNYFNNGMAECVKCPRGTCQPEAGQFDCKPCHTRSLIDNLGLN